MTSESGAPAIELSLVSHTNVGKTSLMRTLLRRDIGEVADRAHVTERAEGHTLLDTPEGEVLRLWDTPGFGDSARLLRRLAASDNPIGWLQTQVWDRFTDRPFFCSQQAVKNVKEESDVVLYLVNASEDPASAGYVEAELRILAWIGKPVLVLLNQTGPARGRQADARDEAAWRHELAAHVGTYRVITLDAFARCWAQEDRLLQNVDAMLPAEKRAAFQRLREAWCARNLEVFEAAMRALAAQLAATATDRETLGEEAGALAMARGAKRWLGSLGSEPGKPDPAVERAMTMLARRLDAGVRGNTDRLIALHGLSGRAAEGILARLAAQFEVSKPADVGKSGVIGGMVTGALGGLAADLSAGGFTFGAGALIGGILGALGATGAARAYNVMSGIEEGKVRWSTPFLAQQPAAALARYLAVAHYGRGRGDWIEGEYPAHWHALIEEVIGRRREEFAAVWTLAQAGGGGDEIARALHPLVTASAREALVRLYPEIEAIWQADVAPRH